MGLHLFLTVILVVSIYFVHSVSAATTKKECTTDVCKTEADRMMKLMNKNADPCEDFSQFACGNFFKEAVIPPTTTRIGSLYDAADKDLDVYKDLLESPVIEHKGKNSYEKKMKTFYKACTDTAAIEAHGLKDYKETYRQDWPSLNTKWLETSYNLKTLTTKYFKLFTQALFKLDPYDEEVNSTSRRHMVKFDDPDLFLKHHDLKKARTSSRIKALQTYYEDMAIALGADDKTAQCDAEEVVNFIIDFSKMIYNAEHKENANRYLTLEEMNKRFPDLDWVSAVQGMFDVMDMKIAPKQTFYTPAYFNDLGKFLAKYDKKVVQNYVGFQHAVNIVGQANANMRTISFNFKKLHPKQPQAQSTRSKYCVLLVEKLYSNGLAKLLSRTRFTKEAEAFIADLFHKIKDAYKNTVKDFSWMSDATRKKAILKLDKMGYLIGIQKEHFTDKDIDEYYKDFVVKENSFNVNLRQNTIQNLALSYKDMNKIVQSWEWPKNHRLRMTRVLSFLWTYENIVVFMLGIMQEPFFGQDYPSYMNYGAFGYYIGLNIGYTINSYGSNYNENGHMENWWTKGEEAKYDNLTECFVKQYSKLRVTEYGLNKNVNGKTKLGQNIADHFASEVAYDAYKMYTKQHNKELPLPGLDLNNDQLFFLSMAQLWCIKYDKRRLQYRMEEGYHTVPAPRINGMLQNNEDFARAYRCKAGKFMNPAKKCSML